MDLRNIVSRLEGRTDNRVITFEKGTVVQRSHATVHDDVLAARAALAGLGVQPGMRVGIRAPNSYQWIVHDLALIDLRAVSVAFTDDFAGVNAQELCDRYSLSLLLVPAGEIAGGRAEGPLVASLDGENTGVRALDRGLESTNETLECPGLIFSSGSSGGLKGLTLHRQGIEASIDVFAQAIDPRPDDCVLLFLPISNFQQRLIYYAALWYGFDLIVTDPSRLFRALKELRPTILIAPPTLYEAFETRFSNLAPWKRAVARAAADVIRLLPSPALRAKAAALLFREVYETLGGRMRFMVTGMAPIKRSTLKLFARMQLPLFETYGMIECGSIALNVPGAHRLGSVGRLLPGIEVELAQDGEIVVHKEHTISSGYFQSGEGEAERTFLGDHRLATGDIGRFDADGYLYLVGRKKEIIVTAGGEKVHPEALESEIDSCPWVAKAVVFGAPGTPSLSVVVLPKDPKDPAAAAHIERFVEGVNQRHPAISIGKVIFTDLAFTRENGFLRPNLKLDRRRISEHFSSQHRA